MAKDLKNHLFHRVNLKVVATVPRPPLVQLQQSKNNSSELMVRLDTLFCLIIFCVVAVFVVVVYSLADEGILRLGIVHTQFLEKVSRIEIFRRNGKRLN